MGFGQAIGRLEGGAVLGEALPLLGQRLVKVMPKLVTGFMRRLLKSKSCTFGNCITATFMGAMLYHQLTRWRAMAWAEASGSKR